jgi:predicted ester cyclase
MVTSDTAVGTTAGALGVTPDTPQPAAAVATERNKAIVRRFVDELWNGARFDVADEIFAAECIPHTHTAHHNAEARQRHGPRHIKAIVAAWRAAFPDWRIEITDLFADGDKVMLLTVGRGTHRGELLGIAPTGRRVTFTGMRTFRIVEGKIAEYWVLWDWLGLWQQLGTIPQRDRPRPTARSLYGVLELPLLAPLAGLQRTLRATVQALARDPATLDRLDPAPDRAR